MNRNGSILVIDDEEIMREILETLLTREGYEVRLAENAAQGSSWPARCRSTRPIVDMMMPGMDGISALDEIKKIDDDLPVLMITAFASVENAIAAMKRGAFDYITKPFKNDEVLVVLRNALAQRRLVAENRALRQNLQAHANRFGEIIGRSSRMRQVFDLIIQAAPSRTTILINGESGTGKELVARSLHQNSARSDRAFITVNSGNLPPDLLESNLFGHVKGAFTGAVYPKKGLFELADKGTIFFDEIGNIPLETQAKLLRVIQEREFMRLGGVETIKVDVRIIAATNVDLRRMMDEGRFREDLYYRLHVITVQLPALRERKDDIPLLVQHFLEKYGEENHKTDLELTPEALDLLIEYDWPGNVRELENVIERAVVLSTGSRIDADLVPDHVRSSKRFQMPQFVVPPEGISYQDAEIAFQRGLIESALEQAGGVQKRAAELLHIKPTTLNEMIKRHDIRPRRKRGVGRNGRRASDDPASTTDGGHATKAKKSESIDAATRQSCASSAPRSALRPQPGEHLLVLPQDHVPPVVLPHVGAAVAAHRGAQAMVGDQQPQALDELVAVGVVQPGVALVAVIDEHLAARVGEDRRADGERLEREQRQALVGRRHDDDGRRFERLEPLLVREPAGEADERLLGQRHQLDAHQHQRRVAAFLHVGAEVLDQLLAALAGIDAAAVERERAVQPVAAAEDGAAVREVRPEARRRLVRQRRLLVRSPPRRRLILGRRCSRGYACACGRSTPQPTVSSSTARIEKCVVRNRRSTSVL